MHFFIKIKQTDIQLVKDICRQQSEHPLYGDRLSVNIAHSKLKLKKESLWKAVITCLLTTQQRSGENSAVARFLKTNYKNIELSVIQQKKNRKSYMKRQLKSVWRAKVICEYADEILLYLEQTDWKLLKDINRHLSSLRTREKERQLAKDISENPNFKGLGPKQARNLLQMIGYSIYEIPIDSRITDWLNRNSIFPFKLSSKSLSDEDLYCFINDAIIELCEKADVKPCLFDAAVFSSFDNAASFIS